MKHLLILGLTWMNFYTIGINGCKKDTINTAQKPLLACQRFFVTLMEEELFLRNMQQNLKDVDVSLTPINNSFYHFVKTKQFSFLERNIRSVICFLYQEESSQ